MARKQVGMSREALAAASNGRLTVRDLSLLEHGRLVCKEAQLSAIQELLGMPFASVVPLRARLIIDPMQGRMVLGGRIAEVVPNASDEELLIRYLAMVYLCRRARPGSFVVPRADDLEVLSELLATSPDSLRQQLAQLCREERDVLRVAVRSASQRRSMPGLGLLVGVHRRGALVLVDPETPPTELRRDNDDPDNGDACIVPIARAQLRKRLTTPQE
jgi:hypothetical protein